jgi:DNA-directed RNA polymerases I and III subunit RPAC1
VNGVDTAQIDNPRKDTASRECLRHTEFKDKVKLMRVRDHFIFSVESTGAVEPKDLVLQSLDVLTAKCMDLKAALADL